MSDSDRSRSPDERRAPRAAAASPPRAARERSPPRRRSRSPPRRRSRSRSGDRRRRSRSRSRSRGRRSPPRDHRGGGGGYGGDHRGGGGGGHRDARGPPPPRPRYSPPRGASTLYATSTSNVVKLQGLPYNVTPEEVLQFFEGYEVKEGSLKLDAARGTNGSGIIKFASAREAGRAVRELDRKFIRDRWVSMTML